MDAPDIADALGYGARDAIRATRAPLEGGARRGYLLNVRGFEALGFGFDPFQVNVVELGVAGIDGLLGLNFLRAFDYEIRSIEGRIRMERAG